MPTFLPAVDYGVGSLPRAVAVGHFDPDSTLDLVTANTSSGSISILLGRGDGTFQTPSHNFAAGSEPFALAVDDLDNDGDLDVVTVNRSDISVLLGNGDGTFQAARTTGIGSPPLSVAVGDFDEDGNLDLGVTSTRYYPGSYGGTDVGLVNVLLGDGTGSFTSSEPIPINPSFPINVAVGDVDGDGNLDLLAAHYGFADTSPVSVLLGDGQGGFLSLPDVSTGAGDDQSLALSDVDGDGDLDLVTAHANSVCVLLGDGTGAFGPVAHHDAGASPRSLAMADFNGDGGIDLVTANHFFAGGYVGRSVSVLIGKGDGSFSPPLVTSAASPPVSVAVGDFNGDGLPDAVTANLENVGTVSVLLNAGDFPAADAPNIRIGDVTVSEGNTGTRVASFTVSLSAAPTSPVTVTYASQDGTATTADGDYVARSGALTFTPGGLLTQTISVTINGDRRGEPNESFAVNLTGASNAYLADASGVGTITDDEPRLSIGNAATVEGNRGTKLLTFTVTLSFAYDVPVTVRFATFDGSATTADNDYVATSGTLTFTPGQTNRTIAVTIIGDKRQEPDEYFFVNLSNATNALLLNTGGTGTILNDDHGGRNGGRHAGVFALDLGDALDGVEDDVGQQRRRRERSLPSWPRNTRAYHGPARQR